jgi:hypothetical protein
MLAANAGAAGLGDGGFAKVGGTNIATSRGYRRIRTNHPDLTADALEFYFAHGGSRFVPVYFLVAAQCR